MITKSDDAQVFQGYKSKNNRFNIPGLGYLTFALTFFPLDTV